MLSKAIVQYPNSPHHQARSVDNVKNSADGFATTRTASVRSTPPDGAVLLLHQAIIGRIFRKVSKDLPQAARAAARQPPAPPSRIEGVHE
jgi:hypothetical protein